MSRTARFSLSSSEDAPTVTLTFTGQHLNGRPVVLATPEDIEQHIAALAASDPDGTWSDLHLYLTVDGEALVLHDCTTPGCDMPDHEYSADRIIGEADADGIMAVFGLDLREVTA
jgi:hypothetical protein